MHCSSRRELQWSLAPGTLSNEIWNKLPNKKHTFNKQVLKTSKTIRKNQSPILGPSSLAIPYECIEMQSLYWLYWFKPKSVSKVFSRRIRTLSIWISENLPTLATQKNSANYPKLSVFRICGCLRVFAGVLRFFAGVLRVILGVANQKNSQSTSILPKNGFIFKRALFDASLCQHGRFALVFHRGPFVKHLNATERTQKYLFRNGAKGR